MAYSRGENVRNPDGVVRAENIATDVLFGLRYPELPSPRGGGGTHYSRKRSFLSPGDYGEKGVPPRERKHRRRRRRRGRGAAKGGGRRRCTLRVDEGVVATGAQAKKQHESGG